MDIFEGLKFFISTFFVCAAGFQVYLSATFQNNKYEKAARGGGWMGRELTLYLLVDILWSMGNNMLELTLTPR